MSRNIWAASAASILVLGVTILSFFVLGSPGTQRVMRSDLRRTQMLAGLAQQINISWSTSGRVLPTSLEKFPDVAKQDPITGKLFVYKPKSANAYELCAEFAKDSQDLPLTDPSVGWKHPKGDYCFQLDADQQVPTAPPLIY